MEPIKIGRIEAQVLTSILAVLSGVFFVNIPYTLLTWFGGLSLPYFDIFHVLFGMFGAAAISWYFFKRSQFYVPEVHGAIPTFLGGRLRGVYLTEGMTALPRWLGFWYSTSPVPSRIVTRQDESGHELEPDPTKYNTIDLGPATEGEKQGFVFLGERPVDIHVSVLSRESAEIIGDATFVFSVFDPYTWKASSNAFGSLISRMRAGLRIVISNFNAGDINPVKSLIPSLLLGVWILVVRCQKQGGKYISGDVARTAEGERIIEKISPSDNLLSKKEGYLDRVKRRADKGSYPTDPTSNDVETLALDDDLTSELKRLGAKSVAVIIRDLTLPQKVRDAAASIEEERAERRAELFQAETRRQSGKVYAEATATSEDRRGMKTALIDAGKGDYIVVEGGDGGDPGDFTKAAAVLNKTKGGNS